MSIGGIPNVSATHSTVSQAALPADSVDFATLLFVLSHPCMELMRIAFGLAVMHQIKDTLLSQGMITWRLFQNGWLLPSLVPHQSLLDYIVGITTAKAATSSSRAWLPLFSSVLVLGIVMLA